MAIVTYNTPMYLITVKNGYFCVRTNTDNSAPTFETTVYSVPTILNIGITPGLINKPVASSGIVFDRVVRKTGAEISLGVVQLPRELLNEIEGGVASTAFFVENITSEGKEFAFGTYFERKDGSYSYVWFPRCKLQPAELSAETSTEDDFPDPEIGYTLSVMPLDNGIWAVWYHTALASGTPLTPAQFFAAPYTNDDEIAPQTNFANIKPVAALPTVSIDATAVYVLTAADGEKAEGTMWRYLNETWTEYEGV